MSAAAHERVTSPVPAGEDAIPSDRDAASCVLFGEIAEASGNDQYRLVEKVTTAPGARTGFYNDELDLLAVGVPGQGKQMSEIRLYQVH